MKNEKHIKDQSAMSKIRAIQKLPEDDLALICGGKTKEDDEPIGEE
ncbi:MAG: hypothetical protein AAF215_19865 [Cyanobacteria bacterium P01_A01_bin.123]